MPPFDHKPEKLYQVFEAISDPTGFIELPDFIKTALYHPDLGYYTAEKNRVGRDNQSDFYTSTSLREAFSEILVEAALGILNQAGLNPHATAWVEIGAEPGAGLLRDIKSPFAEQIELRPGDSLEFPKQAVVFSNELFDAQPFRQIRNETGGWTEYGIRIVDGGLAWAPRPELSPDAQPFVTQITRDCPIGYTIDLPTGSQTLAQRILSQSWNGVFIAFDYGKTWHSLLHDTPQGSARAYSRHKQITDILESPGEIDITHHICWDHLESALTQSGFSQISLQSQESFVITRAPSFLQKAFDPKRSSLDPIRSKLKELIHPALMGQKFQALSGLRT